MKRRAGKPVPVRATVTLDDDLLREALKALVAREAASGRSRRDPAGAISVGGLMGQGIDDADAGLMSRR